MKPSDVAEPARPSRFRDRIRPANLFVGLLGKAADSSLDTPTAVMIPIVGAMLADGHVEEEELFEIEAICAFSPIFDRNSIFENELLIVRATRLIEDHGLEEMCRRAAAMLSSGLRETAFVHAVKVIFSDGHVGTLERQIIDDMMGWLEIDPERARLMIEVVSIMQHPATA